METQGVSKPRANVWRVGVVLGALSLVAIVASLVGGDNLMTAFDRAANAVLRDARMPEMDAVAIAITMFGDTIVLLFIAAATAIALLLVRNWAMAGAAFITSAFTTLLVVTLKGFVQRPRPTTDLYPGVEAFSFPSGHATNSAVVYGVLALIALSAFRGQIRNWLVGGLTGLVITIGLSRIYLAAHWPSDVIAGWLIAGTMLAGFGWSIRKDEPSRLHEQAVLGVALFGALFGFAYGIWNFPGAMEKYAPRQSGPVTVTLHPDEFHIAEPVLLQAVSAIP